MVGAARTQARAALVAVHLPPGDGPGPRSPYPS